MKSSTPKIISGISTTILLMVIAFSVLSSFWFWVAFDSVAAVLVAVGCAGEWYLHHHPSGRKKREKDEHHKVESRCIASVGIGVIMEVFCLAHSIREGIIMEGKVSSANERAEKAIRETADLNVRAQQLESTNLALRTNVAALESKLVEIRITAANLEKENREHSLLLGDVGPRTSISEASMEETRKAIPARYKTMDLYCLVNELKNRPRIRVAILHESKDSFLLARKVKTGLDLAGWEVAEFREIQEGDWPDKGARAVIPSPRAGVNPATPDVFGWMYKEKPNHERVLPEIGSMIDSSDPISSVYNALYLSGASEGGVSRNNPELPDNLVKLFIWDKVPFSVWDKGQLHAP